MASFGGLVLRPWIRELVLGSDALSSPRAGQLLKVSSAPPPDTHTLLRARRPGRGPKAVGLTPVAALRYCRRPRPRARPVPLTRPTRRPCCLYPTGPTVSDA